MERFLTLSLITMLLAACQPVVPPEALQLSPDSMKNRQMQSRLFDSKNEKKMMGSAVGVFQDMGYQISESETKLGLLTATKQADAQESGEMVGLVILALLGNNPDAINNAAKDQKIVATLVSTPSQNYKGQSVVRVTICREVRNQRGQIHTSEPISDPLIYQQFFEKLSKSVFLKENNV